MDNDVLAFLINKYEEDPGNRECVINCFCVDKPEGSKTAYSEEFVKWLIDSYIIFFLKEIKNG